MKIEVLFFGRPRELAGAARKIITVKKGACLADLFRVLENRYGIRYTGDLKHKDAVMVMVNGRNSKNLGEQNTPLEDQDTVAVMPVVVGG